MSNSTKPVPIAVGQSTQPIRVRTPLVLDIPPLPVGSPEVDHFYAQQLRAVAAASLGHALSTSLEPDSPIAHDAQVVTFSGGVTNKLFAVRKREANDYVLVRVFGKGSGVLIGAFAGSAWV